MKSSLMAQNYTENDLLRYLYHEVSEKEKLEMEAQLLVNADLQKAFVLLKSGMESLEKLSEEPSQTSVDIIMEYSQKTSNKNLEMV
ncbi:MAG: hypothetical protein MH472_12480 [Bacteroidia bacterium]|nr:hypothetical protein [Bacteroidia bacterium]